MEHCDFCKREVEPRELTSVFDEDGNEWAACEDCYTQFADSDDSYISLE